MIIVSGTKRSGTSMWMQVLSAAGLPIFGTAFPRNWDRTIREANPGGFYESMYRDGVYYRTNPHPKTGVYMVAEDVRGFAVKVFVPGLIRTERAYIDHVIANVREWREYEASLTRLYAMEHASRMEEIGQIEREGEEVPEVIKAEPTRLPAPYEWWMENYSLLRDIAIRKLPARLQSYDRVLADPASLVREIIAWVGQGDADAAAAAVKPEHRTQTRPSSDSLPPHVAEVCDEIYATIHARQPVSDALRARMNTLDVELQPKIKAMRGAARRARQARAREREQAFRRAVTQGVAPPKWARRRKLWAESGEDGGEVKTTFAP